MACWIDLERHGFLSCRESFTAGLGSPSTRSKLKEMHRNHQGNSTGWSHDETRRIPFDFLENFGACAIEAVLGFIRGGTQCS